MADTEHPVASDLFKYVVYGRDCYSGMMEYIYNCGFILIETASKGSKKAIKEAMND